jgi:hypothetical protein
MQARLGLVMIAAVACSSDKPPAGAPPDAPPADAPPACAAPRVMCGDACVDVTTDVANCGACGHACGCGSTSCTNGACDAHVLADQQGAPVVLALHAGNLYWATDADRNVWTMPADASAAARVLFPGRTAVRGFAFDDARVYFTRTVFNIVEAGTLDGKTSGNYTNQQERGAAGIATDATRAYWADGGFGTIRSAPLGAPVQPPTTLATDQVAPDGVALDDDHVYWTTHSATGQVLALAKTAASGTAPSVLASAQPNPHAIAVADGFVYWTDQGDGSAESGSVQRVAVGGGPITTLADHQPGPAELALADGFVYWTDSVAGTLVRVPVDGGAPPVAVVSGQASPSGLVVANACVYFTTLGDGQLGHGSVRSLDAP